MKGVVAQHVARAMGMKTNISKIVDLLAELDTSAPVMADYDVTGTYKLGIGAIEGPRENGCTYGTDSRR